MDMTIRPRRLRTSAKLRKMVRETRMDARAVSLYAGPYAGSTE